MKDVNAHVLRVPCPNCGEKAERSIGQLEKGGHLKCPACGASIKVGRATENEESIAKQIVALKKSLKFVFKKPR